MTMTRLIGSESILVCEGALPDLGLTAARLIFRSCHGGGGGRYDGGSVILLLAGFFVQYFLISACVMWTICVIFVKGLSNEIYDYIKKLV